MRRIIAILLLLLLHVVDAHAADRPNILWLSTEDMSPHLGCYGDEDARTPNLDALASQGVLYKNAFVPAPVCAVCRSAIITGVYAPSLGTHHMRSRVKLSEEIRCFTEYLRNAGYYCTNNAKEDYNFRTPKTAWDESSGRAHWRDRPRQDQPFFAVFNFTGTHESAVRGDEPKYSQTIASLSEQQRAHPGTLTLPPYYPDTPKVRAHWGRYYNTISALDQWIGERLAELDEAGLAEDTIVVFWSDHGAGLPRAKRWLYDSGLRVPLIVRVPEKFRKLRPGLAGSQSDRLVSLIDLGPSVLSLCELPIPEYMQGQPFLGADLPSEREFVFASRDRMDESYDCSRAIRTKRYKYIRNFMPWRPWAQFGVYPENNDLMRELRRMQCEGKLSPDQALFMGPKRPAEELYDLVEDPHELHNLLPNRFAMMAGQDSPPREPFMTLPKRLIEWQLEIRDLGVIPEAVVTRRVGSKTAPYLWARESLSDEAYGHMFKAASQASLPLAGSHAWLPSIKDDEEVVRYWAVAEGPGNMDRVEPYMELLRSDPSPTVRLAAAEYLATRYQAFSTWFTRDATAATLNEQRIDEAVSALLQLYEHAATPFDQVYAAGILDLLPDFQAIADRLEPINERVAAQQKGKRKESPASNYLSRWADRFSARLASDTRATTN
jgi:arylsulfatase A-like enzyme